MLFLDFENEVLKLVNGQTVTSVYDHSFGSFGFTPGTKSLVCGTVQTVATVITGLDPLSPRFDAVATAQQVMRG